MRVCVRVYVFVYVVCVCLCVFGVCECEDDKEENGEHGLVQSIFEGYLRERERYNVCVCVWVSS